MGWPECSIDEIRHFVGNGVHRLIELSVPSNTTSSELEICFGHFQQHYLLHCQDYTCLYPGVEEMLHLVHEFGYKTAIVSNKLQAGVDELFEKYFRGVVDIAVGEREGIQRKPAPDMVRLAMNHLNVSINETVYVGDSEVDVATAKNSGLPCISVLWGFRNRNQLLEAGATRFIEHPSQLLNELRTLDSIS